MPAIPKTMSTIPKEEPPIAVNRMPGIPDGSLEIRNGMPGIPSRAR